MASTPRSSRPRGSASGDRSVLAGIDAAFAAVTRPLHFTEFAHCAECAEHDERLQATDGRRLQLEDVAYPGFDPFCVALPASFVYFLPALARLALNAPHAEHGWYAAQLRFHLDAARRDNGFHAQCTPAQRAAVAALLRHLLETRRSLIEDARALDSFADCYRFWAEPAHLN